MSCIRIELWCSVKLESNLNMMRSDEKRRSRSISQDYSGASKKSAKKRRRTRSSSSSSSSSSTSSSSSSSSSSRERSNKSRKSMKQRNKSRASSSGSSSSSSSSSSGASERKRRHKKRKKSTDNKKKKKEKKRKKKEKRKERRRLKKKRRKSLFISLPDMSAGPSLVGPKTPDSASKAKKVMKPMTLKEWEAQQSIVRRVVDPETGRERLVKGDGEIIEEIVSRERQKEINKQATIGDATFYAMKAGLGKI